MMDLMRRLKKLQRRIRIVRCVLSQKLRDEDREIFMYRIASLHRGCAIMTQMVVSSEREKS